MNWTEGPSQERHREEEDEHQPTLHMYEFDQSSSIVKGAGFFSISQNVFLPKTLYFGMS